MNNPTLKDALESSSDAKKQEALDVLSNSKLEGAWELLSDPKSQKVLKSLNSVTLDDALQKLNTSIPKTLLVCIKQGVTFGGSGPTEPPALVMLNFPDLKAIFDSLVSALENVTELSFEVQNDPKLLEALKTISDPKLSQAWAIANGEVKLDIEESPSTIDLYMDIMTGKIKIN